MDIIKNSVEALVTVQDFIIRLPFFKGMFDKGWLNLCLTRDEGFKEGLFLLFCPDKVTMIDRVEIVATVRVLI